jgi:hypothetical protein
VVCIGESNLSAGVLEDLNCMVCAREIPELFSVDERSSVFEAMIRSPR